MSGIARRPPVSGIAWRRVRFWSGVACVSVISHFALELAAQRTQQLGLAKFTAFTHKGAS